MNPIIGIDLGTTNSEVAIIQDGQPLVIPDTSGKRILPSVVGLSPAGELLVGEEARNQYVVAPERTVRSVKRLMGADERLKLGDDTYTPQEISAFILRRLKQIAEEHLGTSAEQAVITVPAYFSDRQRQATRDAGEIAGLEVVRIINEPTAAALTYGLDRDEDQFLAVYDLGGGTFDVSIIEINSGVIEVRASHGDTQLGGDDFDAALVRYIVEDFRQQHGVDLKEDRRAYARVMRAAEQAKIALSTQPFAMIREEFIAGEGGRPLHLEMEIARDRFEALIMEMLESTVECMDQALDDASIARDEIDKVLMVGGSTRIPLVYQLVSEHLDAEPHLEINPELCVAMGASVQAGIIAGEPIDAILVDIASRSLGIEVAEWQFGMPLLDRYSVLIPRNTTIPTSRSEVYTTLSDAQEAVDIKVYQGDNEVASENTLLGEFRLEGLRRTARGKPEVIVTFDYDVDGIVHVTAKDKQTNQQQKISVTATPDRLTDEEKESARERVSETEIAVQGLPTAGHEEAIILLERALQLGRQLEDPAQKEELQELIVDLQEALGTGESDQIEDLQDQLLDLLYELEG